MFHLDGIIPTTSPIRTLLTSQMHLVTSRRNVTAPSVAPGQGSFPGTYSAEGVSASVTACKSSLLPSIIGGGISRGQLITEAAAGVDSLITAAVLVNVRILTNVLASVC